MTDREAFEAQLECAMLKDKNKNGDYAWNHVQQQWIGWQAACKYKDEAWENEEATELDGTKWCDHRRC